MPPTSPHNLAEQPELAHAVHQPRSIVVVEDNPSVAAGLQAALEQAGHTVHIFADGHSALAAVSQLKPDALVLDIGLPDMTGYELAARLKESETTKHAPRIAVSGLNLGDRSADHDGRFDYYFSKPVDIRALLAVLDQL